jgi:hypothetical protein
MCTTSSIFKTINFSYRVCAFPKNFRMNDVYSLKINLLLRMMERQWVYCAVQAGFQSPLDNDINKCNVKYCVRVALSTVNPRHIHCTMFRLNEFHALKD